MQTFTRSVVAHNKARELCYRFLLLKDLELHYIGISYSTAKNCALIVCDEAISAGGDKGFWDAVKTELETL